ncbi:RelA/SpoT domain-containing protein [Vibrio cincinnatiensis]|uniref:RelA/SpoT domain-containing protein n=1 Tax=Vibrio cincinnatiensis TaxID=675 RepID=UPI001EDF2F01|nr:GTP pyrophosphokinase [Vibrio cincinnatiensis]
MAIVQPTSSKKAVMRAGQKLADCYGANCPLEGNSLDILNNWRLSHSYPLEKIRTYLEQSAQGVDPKALIAQRIKRVPSIVGKLNRFSTMRLDRMQDLGGCRAVVSSIEDVYKVVNKIKNTRFMHELKNEKDYIDTPKDSGYRSYHLVYAFQNKKYEKLNGLQIEMQIRTAVQHSWATAVEVVGAFTAQSLKSNQGNERWLEFFKLASNYFQELEQGKRYRNAPEDLKKMCEEMNVNRFVRACAVTANHIDKEKHKWASYFLMELDPQKGNIKITSYPTNLLKKAGDDYLEAEYRCKDIDGAEAALVSTNDPDNLRNAYPNYFADTRTFMNNLGRVLGNI